MAGRINRAGKWLDRIRHPIAARLVARAKALRADGHLNAAAILYAEAARAAPRRAGAHVQAGHMFKEAGDLASAEQHYLQARALIPDDEDLALQLGHFYKVAGRLEEAASSYRRAVELGRGGSAAEQELASLGELAGVTAVGADAPADAALLVPELMPRRGVTRARLPVGDAIQLRRLGRSERSAWGVMRTLRGVEAVRGFCMSAVPIVAVEVLLDGAAILRAAPRVEPTGTAIAKHVFNLWHDFSTAAVGPHRIELRCIDASGRARALREPVVVVMPFTEDRYPASDGIVTLDPADLRPPEAQIQARPSMVRPARRALLTRPPRAVLVQRVDQLGDLVVSVPALRRLRQIWPDARLVGLLSPANALLARTLNLFDEIVVADFPECEEERRRVMPQEAQAELRASLAAYRFDLAIDLSLGVASRPLLSLSGASLRCGFGDRAGVWLDIGMDGFSHDAANGNEALPHGRKLLALVEWLGAMLADPAPAPARPTDRPSLSAYGIDAGESYALLHTGARLAFSRWHGFAQLARLILERTRLKVVMMADDGNASIPEDLAASPRFRRVEGQIPFDDFDALLSGCAVMVGNDSGPKHLAALRGAKVVSIHMARINWAEWAQEGEGLVVSRRVPCAGCSIHYEPEECGKDFACIAKIDPEEVFAAVARLL